MIKHGMFFLSQLLRTTLQKAHLKPQHTPEQPAKDTVYTFD